MKCYCRNGFVFFKPISLKLFAAMQVLGLQAVKIEQQSLLREAGTGRAVAVLLSGRCLVEKCFKPK